MRTHRGLARIGAAAAVTVFGLAACGGGENVVPAAAEAPAVPSAPSAPSGVSDPPTTVTAFAASRAAATPAAAPAVEPAALLQAATALALPALQTVVTGVSGDTVVADAAIVLPGLQAARIDVLGAAAAGATLTELAAALPSAVTDATVQALTQGVSRKLWASPTGRFERGFLAATETFGTSATWQNVEVADVGIAFAAVADYGPTGSLDLGVDTRLVIGQRFDAEAAIPGAQVTPFVGVGQRTPDTWYTAPMLALEGPGGTLTGDSWVAVATWVGEHLWVALRPPGDAALYAGVPWVGLQAALRAAREAFPAPEGVTSRSTQVWPQATFTLENRSRLPSGVVLPYDKTAANLSRLDGGGTYLRETFLDASLTIGPAALVVAGAQAMAFTFSVTNPYGGSSSVGVITTNPGFDFPPACPRAMADWRGAYLAVIDRAGRMVLAASLPTAGAAATTCRQP